MRYIQTQSIGSAKLNQNQNNTYRRKCCSSVNMRTQLLHNRRFAKQSQHMNQRAKEIRVQLNRCQKTYNHFMDYEHPPRLLNMRTRVSFLAWSSPNSSKLRCMYLMPMRAQWRCLNASDSSPRNRTQTENVWCMCIVWLLFSVCVFVGYGWFVFVYVYSIFVRCRLGMCFSITWFHTIHSV